MPRMSADKWNIFGARMVEYGVTRQKLVMERTENERLKEELKKAREGASTTRRSRSPERDRSRGYRSGRQRSPDRGRSQERRSERRPEGKRPEHGIERQRGTGPESRRRPSSPERHPRERVKARVSCPFFKQGRGTCKKGDACDMSHASAKHEGRRKFTVEKRGRPASRDRSSPADAPGRRAPSRERSPPAEVPESRPLDRERSPPAEGKATTKEERLATAKASIERTKKRRGQWHKKGTKEQSSSSSSSSGSDGSESSSSSGSSSPGSPSPPRAPERGSQ